MMMMMIMMMMMMMMITIIIINIDDVCVFRRGPDLAFVVRGTLKAIINLCFQTMTCSTELVLTLALCMLMMFVLLDNDV